MPASASAAYMHTAWHRHPTACSGHLQSIAVVASTSLAPSSNRHSYLTESQNAVQLPPRYWQHLIPSPKRVFVPLPASKHLRRRLDLPRSLRLYWSHRYRGHHFQASPLTVHRQLVFTIPRFNHCHSAAPRNTPGGRPLPDGVVVVSGRTGR